nr:hypothetical protein [Desulfobacula sp.]
QQYIKIINKLSSTSGGNIQDDATPDGPLSALLFYIYEQWSELTNSDVVNEFISWLETAQGTSDDALFALDSLDGLLISAIHEFEEMGEEQIDIEVYLGNLWKQTFSNYATEQDADWMMAFKTRGNALVKTIYPQKSVRTALYNTSLPPRDGSLMLQQIDEFIAMLQDGINYAGWDRNQRFNYLLRLIDAVRVIPSFAFSDEKHITIKELLAWWLWPNNKASKKPTPASISKWYNLGAKKFSYLFNWGIGSLIATVLNQNDLSGTTMERWKGAGLPWSIIWIKDLISWGVYDPVAAFLLSQKKALTRQDAYEIAKEYWIQVDMNEGDILLDPRKIKKWFDIAPAQETDSPLSDDDFIIPIKPLVDIKTLSTRMWRILPVVIDNSVKWYDVAGYLLAISIIPEKWDMLNNKRYNYFLDTHKNIVIVLLE